MISVRVPPSAQRAELGEPALVAGDPAPLFIAEAADGNPFSLATAAGRYLLLSFIGSRRLPASAAFLAGLRDHAALWRRPDLAVLLVDDDDADRATIDSLPQGIQMVWDKSSAALAMYRAALPPPVVATYAQAPFPITVVLNANQRIMALFITPDGATQAAQVAAYLRQVPVLPPLSAARPQAPVLMVPYVFEPDLCQRLIAGHQQGERVDSGYMIERNGVTHLVVDHQKKRRQDWLVTDGALLALIRKRIIARLIPEIRKAFAFEASAIERFVVACYDAEGGGYFRRHRDNTTPATRHRRFAVSLNLNAEDFEGGDLFFPEYGTLTHRPPTGGAVVFSCSLMHEALPVTRGKRYAFLPFLYDEAARQQRMAYLASTAAKPASPG
jgi:predicted 2-oxoglutarate/Fe(II)-dependent dioxygenase YbiX/peroxiredoxin